MARWLKTQLNKVGWDLTRYVKIPQQPFSVLPYLVAEQLKKDPDFFFLQIGANDGVFDDPLHELVLKYDLRGLLVEPLPNLFERLKANYSGSPGLLFEQCAVGPNDGQMILYRPRLDAPVPKKVHGLVSFNRSHLIAHYPEVEKHIEEVKVNALTLKTLLAKHNIRNVTLLQIDTEGFDCEIVKMALEAGLPPAIINYEFVHCPPWVQADCKNRLAEAGYNFIDVGIDTLASRISSSAWIASSQPQYFAKREGPRSESPL